MNYEQQNTESAGRRYLRYLLHRAHEIGVPYLPVENLTERSVSNWIDYLRERVDHLDTADARRAETQEEQKDEEASSPYLLTPSRARAPDGYRPPWDLAPQAFDHDHIVDMYLTEDQHEITYCTLCGTEW